MNRRLALPGGTHRLELTRRLVRALDVAAKTVEAFAAHGYEDPEDPALSFGAEKVVAETAMLLHAASRAAASPEVRERVDDLAVSLVGPARSDEVLARAALHPSLAEGLAVPHVLLTRLGHPDPDVDAFLLSCAASSGAGGHELPPYGALEKLWIRELWGRPARPDEWGRVLSRSVLGASPDLLGGLREDGYAFTHGLMYATDFGGTARVLPRAPALVLEDARALLAVYVESGDYDLVGELLMAWPFLGERHCPVSGFVLRALAAAEDEAGLLPGGTTSAERLRSLAGARRRRYAVATSYHTAYVMGMLCAASLQPARPARVHASSTRLDWSAIDDMLLDGDPAVDQPDLRRIFATLSGSECRHLAGFRLDLSIARAARRGRYASLAELLVRLEESGQPISPLARHTEELLARLALGLSPRTRPRASLAAFS